MPVHLAQMNALEHEELMTYEALKSEDFVVTKSEIPFTRLLTDQTLEQEIMKLCQPIELHCKGNPFTVESPLKSVLSSALVPEKAK